MHHPSCTLDLVVHAGHELANVCVRVTSKLPQHPRSAILGAAGPHTQTAKGAMPEAIVPAAKPHLAHQVLQCLPLQRKRRLPLAGRRTPPARRAAGTGGAGRVGVAAQRVAPSAVKVNRVVAAEARKGRAERPADASEVGSHGGGGLAMNAHAKRRQSWRKCRLRQLTARLRLRRGCHTTRTMSCRRAGARPCWLWRTLKAVGR